jgi:hypothetical protein
MTLHDCPSWLNQVAVTILVHNQKGLNFTDFINKTLYFKIIFKQKTNYRFIHRTQNIQLL